MPPRAKDTTAPPKPRKSRAAVQTPDSSDVEVASTGATTKPKKKRETVNWIKNPTWTDDIITYLSEDPAFRIKLFSDSTADAKQDGRRKLVGKDGKPQLYAQLAKHVFADNPDEQARYLNNPAKYATSVETRLRRLKKEYKGLVETLGATGAGLEPDQVLPGSNIASLLDDIRSKWPWWDDLHAFWRELPNYNPIGVQSSEPGTDHASDAKALFQPPAPTEDEDEDEGRSITSIAGDDDDDGADDQSHESERDEEDDDLDDFVPAPARQRSSSPDPMPPPAIEPAPKKQTAVPAPKKAKPGGGRDLGLAKAHESSSSARSGAVKGKKPVTAIDRMNDLRETESARLGQKREMQHEEEMERIKVKRLKLEVKLLQAQNERRRLNQHAWSTPASPRSPRRACTPSRGLYSPARLPQLPYMLPSSSRSTLSTSAASSSSSGLHDGQDSFSTDDFMALAGYSMPEGGAGYEFNTAASGDSEPWPVLPRNSGDLS